MINIKEQSMVEKIKLVIEIRILLKLSSKAFW
jgi:hypothetical protein